MNVKINFDNFVRQLLPSHKRQPVRLSFLRALLRPLVWLFGLFDVWRYNIRREINMTGQVGILEGYLRHKYGDVSMRIETYIERGFAVGLRAEGIVNAQPVGKDPFDTNTEERPEPAAIPLRGEIRDNFGDVDFVVYVPQGIDLEAVRIDVERFKQVLVTYKITEQ